MQLLILMACSSNIDINESPAGGPGPADTDPPEPTYTTISHPFGDDVFTEVSVGNEHACARRPDGGIECRGVNQTGETIPPVGAFLSVEAGNKISCATESDGTVVCWGRSGHPLRTGVPAVPLAGLSIGSNEACALDDDAVAVCWPDTLIPPMGNWTQVEVGDDQACGLSPDQTIYCGLPGEPSPYQAPEGEYVDLAVGRGFACGVHASGSLSCWGSMGQFPFDVPSGDDFVKVDARLYHGCAQREDGTLACWLGNDYRFPQPQGAFTSFSVGGYAACGIDATGTITCWRDNKEWE